MENNNDNTYESTNANSANLCEDAVSNPAGESSSQNLNANLLMCVFYSERDFYELGLAVLDLTVNSLNLLQFNDNQNYDCLNSRIQAFLPSEILLPSLSTQNLCVCKLKSILMGRFKKISFVDIKSNFFNRKRGFELVDRYCMIDYTNCSGLYSQSYAIMASSALIRYIETVRNLMLTSKSIRLIMENDENLTIIDTNACRSLELVHNARSLKSSHTLLGLLNHTRTKNGQKTLRANLLQPTCNVELIERRLNVIECMRSNLEVFDTMRSELKNFYRLDEVITFSYQPIKRGFDSVRKTDSKIQQLYYLKFILTSAKVLYDFLQGTQCEPIKACFKDLYDEYKYNKIIGEIDAVFEEDFGCNTSNTYLKMQKCFAVKDKIHGILDVSRRAYAEILQEIQTYVAQVAGETELPIKFGFNSVRGFYMHISVKEKKNKNLNNTETSSIFSTNSLKMVENLPADFIKVSKTQSSIQFTTQKLLRLNERVNSCLDEIYLITDNILNQLMLRLKEHYQCLYKISECLSNMDMLISLTLYSLQTKECVRPRFETDVHLLDSYHPLLKKIKENASSVGFRNDAPTVVSQEKLVPNTIRLTAVNPFVLITGANMSGKSTLIKQLGLVQIMGQCGSFLPAGRAFMSAKKRIFTSSGDYSSTTTLKLSSFEQELTEIKHMLEHLDQHSLILIDELCRNTNFYEGLALSIGICDYILDYQYSNYGRANCPHVLVSTHNKQLAYFEYVTPLLRVFHMDSAFDKDKKLCHTYKLKPGVSPLMNYGLSIIQLESLPDEIIEETRQMISMFNKNLEEIFGENLNRNKKKLIYEVHNGLYDICKEMDQLNDETLVEKIELLLDYFETEYCKLSNIQ